jgi:hypothetical protein
MCTISTGVGGSGAACAGGIERATIAKTTWIASEIATAQTRIRLLDRAFTYV